MSFPVGRSDGSNFKSRTIRFFKGPDDLVTAAALETLTLTGKWKTEPPRKQMNMKPETMRKVEELLKLVRGRGPQRTTAMSEVFDALIGVLYEARDSIDLSGVPKIGRWGSATASAFVTALGQSFADAIAAKTRK